MGSQKASKVSLKVITVNSKCNINLLKRFNKFVVPSFTYKMVLFLKPKDTYSGSGQLHPTRFLNRISKIKAKID